MELVGEQKRIQALFSELRLADEQTVPRFAVVWNRAQARSSRTWRPAPAFNFSFVAVTALLICALISLALWSRYSQQNARHAAAVATGTAIPPDVPVKVVKEAAGDSSLSEASRDRPASMSRVKRLATRRRALMLAINLKAAREAMAISSWQSPTTALLKSQNDELLKSLPQLNEGADNLKSFLTNTSK
jgi:hypothetical protein